MSPSAPIARPSTRLLCVRKICDAPAERTCNVNVSSHRATLLAHVSSTERPRLSTVTPNIARPCVSIGLSSIATSDSSWYPSPWLRESQASGAPAAAAATRRPSTNNSNWSCAGLPGERRRRLDRDRARQLRTRLQPAGLDRRNSRPGTAQRIAHDQHLRRTGNRLVIRLGQRAAAGIMHVNLRQREFLGRIVGFDDRSARTRGAVADELGERRLPARFAHHAGKAGQTFANGSGQDRRAGLGPVERGHADQRAGHVAAIRRQGSLDDGRAHAQLLELFDRRGKLDRAGRRALVVAIAKIDRALGQRAVGPGGARQRVGRLAHGVSAAARKGQHRREHVRLAAGLDQPAAASPAVPTVKAA